MEVQRNPSNELVVETVAHSRDSLRKLQTKKLQGAKTRARLNWIKLEDRGSKFIFNALKGKESRDVIDWLCEEGLTINSQQNILHAFASYYSKLFSSDYIGQTMDISREKIGGIMKKRLPLRLP